MQQSDRLHLFPDTTRIEDNSLMVDGQKLGALAQSYGTPVYVYDRATMDNLLSRYQSALRSEYPGTGLITYAGKAFLCKAIAEWADDRKLWLDCTGEAEVSLAVGAKFPSASIIVHGVNKSIADIQAALQHAGTIVIDNLHELELVGKILDSRNWHSEESGTAPGIWLRFRPGLAPTTHHRHTQTGQAASKFGMTREEILACATLARRLGLPVTGLHFHLGSNFRELALLSHAIDLAMRTARELSFAASWHFCPGGGWSVAYREDELPEPGIETYVRTVAQEVIKRCRLYGLSSPVLHLEPGRSLIARSGVALYRVGAVKRSRSRTWLLVDGGMADNPRFALYGANYSCLPATGLGREIDEVVSVGGPCCESGDVIVEDLAMPHIESGEVIAIPVSGAYQLSMSSNYNGTCRPAVVWLEGGKARLIVRRETSGEIFQRDLSLR